VPAPELEPDTVATILYTGGTTGRPKGVLLSHANVLANSKHMLHVDALSPSDRFLHAGPLFHTGSAQMIHPVTWAGGTHIMLPRFTPAGFVDLLIRHRVTATMLVPTMIYMVLDHLSDHPAEVTSLRLIHYGASPMSPNLLERAMETFDCDFAQGYGMTEAAPGVGWLTAEAHRLAREGVHPERLASAGHAIPGVQLEVRDVHGTPVPDGTVGEVWVRGPNVMMGYHNLPDETERAFADGGWYRTGDAGYTDSDGFLFLVDRFKDMIISGGENVYSVEVEQAVSSHDAVGEVAVIGLPDPKWGERVHAIVVPRPGRHVEPDEIIAHVRTRIAAFKAPKSVEIRSDPLPKSGVGKILKHRLRSESPLAR
jgi:long-chain acyl-CoA synthetase